MLSESALIRASSALRVHLFRGAILGTLLRNDALSFIGIGTLIERASATAQLLLIKDQQLTSDPDPVREYYRLDTLLNAVSAREAYNSIYRQPVSRETVMELLILRDDVPRSLRASISDLVGQLEQIANDRSHLPLRLAHQLNVDLRFSTRSLTHSKKASLPSSPIPCWRSFRSSMRVALMLSHTSADRLPRTAWALFHAISTQLKMLYGLLPSRAKKLSRLLMVKRAWRA